MGRQLAETILSDEVAQPRLDIVAFLDDAAEKQGTKILGIPVFSPQWMTDHAEVEVLLGVGHPWQRQMAAVRIRQLGGEFATFVHSSSRIWPSAHISVGCTIMPGCIISSNSQIGELVHINFHTAVSHDVIIGKYACIMAQVALSGNVRVGEGAFVGAGTCTCQEISIGEWTIVGAGASVAHDIPAYCVAVGVPAQPTRHYGAPQEMPPI